jgi:hypothetical protein
MVATAKTDNMGRTSIQVSEKLADELYSRKNRGESYEDVIWRLVNEADAQNRIAASDSPERADTIERSPEVEAVQEPVEEPVEDTTSRDGPAVHLEDVEFPGSKDREACVEAVLAAYEYLQENGKATMRQFVAEVMPEHPISYDVPDLEPGERYRGAWWRKVVKPGLEALPDVERPPRGGSDWTYRGGNGEF